MIGDEREAAIRICRRVDGMPLAIELAAAWVNVLSCTEIALEIERSFAFLSSTGRDVPERHRSLRAAFEHSWNRLTASEQDTLSSLTIFSGWIQSQCRRINYQGRKKRAVESGIQVVAASFRKWAIRPARSHPSICGKLLERRIRFARQAQRVLSKSVEPKRPRAIRRGPG
ncbi:hypothetical protein [Candidatus Villigracilis affinis]|uniref:hypothetical protein n=1 Tax=Candidatus Villigracilis affinis TaxID=3140682 RepID=UPI002A197B58|nr:hypothetical protein [Anaerolineales bacterium]